MARNNINYSKQPNQADLIPIGIFSVAPTVNTGGNEALLTLNPFTNKQVSTTDVGITYNHLLDKIFIFSHDDYLTENSLYFKNNWTISTNDKMYGYFFHFPVISIMVHPSTIYKINNINFANNYTMRKVHDLYTFTLNDIDGLFKNCVYLTDCDVDRFGPSIVVPGTNPSLDMLFANCISLVIGQSATSKSKWLEDCNNNPDIKVSMNYALMNTPNLKNNTFFHSIVFTVDENGGKGIFLNSNINHAPVLNLSNVYELRNTFSGSTTNIDPFPYSTDISSAKIADAMFKDSTCFSNINLNNPNNLKIINNILKDNTSVNTFTMGYNLSVNEGSSMFSGCINLMHNNSNILFNNCEYTPDLFKNCNKLLTFYNPHLENSKIVSGVYEGCTNLTGINDVLNKNGEYEVILPLNNAVILNNMFKKCKNFNIGYVNIYGNIYNRVETEIGLHNEADIYADGMFEGCESLTKHPILNDDGIISTACMYKDCIKLTNTGICDFINSKDSSGMYKGCSALNSHNMPINNSPVITSSMFEDCVSLTGGQYNLVNTTFTANMFKNCASMSTFNSTYTSENSIDVSGMFEGCTNITSTPQVFNSRSAVLMNSTFRGCRRLRNLDICLDNAKNIDGIFYGCSSLSILNIILNKTNFNRFPRINLRGTSITTDNFIDIANKLPDMSKYVNYNNGQNIIPEISWSLINPLDIFSTKSGYTAWKTQNVTLVPGRYYIDINNSYNIAVALVKVTDSGNEAISPLIYTNGIHIGFTVDIDEEAKYFIYEYNNEYSGGITIKWIEPYYHIDIRNTPVNYNYSTVNNAIINLNNKGWHVITHDALVIPETAAYSVRTVEVDNYLEGVNILTSNDLNESEEFTLPAGFYNIFDENDIIDKIKVYKVTENGSYPIAMSYTNEHFLNFEIMDECIIKIKYRYNSDGLKIKKM